MSIDFRYQPGTAVAIVHQRIAVLLDAAADDPVVTRVADLVRSGAGVDDVLDALATSGLKDLVDFGAFEVRPDGVRLVVRGKVTGSVGAVAGLSAERTMWHDTWQPGQQAAGIAVAGVAEGPELALSSGVVLASTVTFGELGAVSTVVPDGTSTPSPPPAPEAMIAPASEIDPSAVPAAAVEVPAAEPVVSVAGDDAPTDDAPAEADAEAENGSDFAHLFGATQRPPDPGAVDDPVAAPRDAEAEPSVEIASLEAEPSAPDPAATMSAPLTIPAEELPGREAASTPAAPGLITGMPWLSGSAPPAPAPTSPAPVDAPVTTPVPMPVAVPAPAMTPPPAATVPAPPAPLASIGSPGEAPSDRTINRAALVGRSAMVTVTAVRCGQGHFNPPYAGNCRVCGTPIAPQQPVEIPRPTLGQLRLSTGGVVPLDRPAFLGRNPQVPTGYAGEQPNLVRLPDPDKDVSGQHLEVSFDYWNVMVRDLGSTNGTEVILPGEMPVALRANDPVIIEPGSRVILAGTISFIFEVVS